MKAISFKTALSKLTSNPIKINTLGGRSQILVSKEGANALRIENSKGTAMVIDEKHWDKVMAKVDSLPENEREMPTRYQQGAPKIPHQRFSPYIPAVLRYILNL